MDAKQMVVKKCTIIIALIFLLMSYSPPPGITGSLPPDIFLTFNNFDATLSIFEDLMGIKSEGESKSPLFMVNAMLQGYDWIDFTRSTRIGIDLTDEKPHIAMYIPYLIPNTSFQTSYNAISGGDHYILSLPPGTESKVPDSLKSALINPSHPGDGSSVSCSINLDRILEKFDDKIKQIPQAMEKMQGSQSENPFDISPADLSEMFINLIGIAGQIDNLNFTFDVNEKKLFYSFGLKAKNSSEIAKLFSREKSSTLLDGYAPNQAFNFRSKRYDVERSMEFFDKNFGKFYEKLGIDFSKIKETAASFTGEMAGGLSYDKDKIIIETISLLTDSEDSSNYLESVCLPFLTGYCTNLAKIIKKTSPSGETPKIFQRIPDTEVAGHRVMGARIKFPLVFYQGFASPGVGQKQTFIDYHLKMAVVDNLFFVASDDSIMKNLIELSRTFSPGLKQDGPLATMDINISEYFNAMFKMIPVKEKQDYKPLPEMGDIISDFEMNNGEMRSTFSMNIDDIKLLIAHFKSLTPLPPFSSSSASAPSREPHMGPPSPPYSVQTETAVKKDYAYWQDRGSLCATYGNEKWAINYFQKAVELDPGKSEAYFQLGISHGELSDFEKALSFINQAIEKQPDKGLYYYGRGRVYLLKGDKKKGITDFVRAAELGNRDASDYLKIISGY